MPALPTVSTFVDGPSSSSQLNQLVAFMTFLSRPPIAQLRSTAGQTFTSGTAAALQFNAADVDTDVDGVGGHDPVTNNTRWTCRYPGWHVVGGGLTFAANATGVRAGWLRINGIDIAGSLVELAAVGGGLVTALAFRTVEVFCAQGDYLEWIGFQNSGGNLATSVASTLEQPHGFVFWKSATT